MDRFLNKGTLRVRQSGRILRGSPLGVIITRARESKSKKQFQTGVRIGFSLQQGHSSPKDLKSRPPCEGNGIRVCVPGLSFWHARLSSRSSGIRFIFYYSKFTNEEADTPHREWKGKSWLR